MQKKFKMGLLANTWQAAINGLMDCIQLGELDNAQTYATWHFC